MRGLNSTRDLVIIRFHPLAMIFVGMAAPVWGVTFLALCLTLLISGVLSLAMSAPLCIVLAPLLLACRSWFNWRWDWLGRPNLFSESWSWLCRYWFRGLWAVLELAEPTRDSRVAQLTQRTTSVSSHVKGGLRP